MVLYEFIILFGFFRVAGGSVGIWREWEGWFWLLAGKWIRVLLRHDSSFSFLCCSCFWG